MKPKKMDETAINNAVRQAIKEAVDFCESEIAPSRIRAAKYMEGQVDLEHEEGLSKVVATVCRDTVRMVKPSLMRTFLQSGVPVEFAPKGQDDIDAAEQATEYVNWKFNENNGFRVLSDVIDNALEKKTGVAKVYWDEAQEVEFDDYRNLVPEELALVEQEEGVEVLEIEQNDDGTLDVKVSKTSDKGCLKMDSLAPEDFFVDSGATSIENFFVVGDSEEMRVGDVVEQGFDFEEIFKLAGTSSASIDEEEEFQRTGYTDEDGNEAPNDPSMRIVVVTEAYMRMDIEGTGVPRLYQFICAGKDYKVLKHTPADHVPYAIFEVDPRPHTFFGWSLVDLVIDDQDPASSLLRAAIDNAHHSNNPKMIVDTNIGNVEDALNNEIGAVYRAKGPGGYTPIVVPSNIAAMLPMMEHYNRKIEDKAGVSKASLGMDANALQSTTAAGVNAAVQAGSAHAELMARNLAEGGMRQLFRLMMKLTRANAPANEMMRLNGSFVPVDPQSWNADMDLRSRVGLGTGQKEQRMMALQQVLVDQQQVYQSLGPGNPIVSMAHMYNTRADLLELAGVHSVTRYYNPVTPQMEDEMLAKMAQASQQQGSDPNDAFLQAESLKVQEKAQANAQKHQRDQIKMLMDDDFRRDELAQDRVMEAVKMLGEYGIKVNEQAIRQEQAVPRQPMQQG